MVRLVAAFSLAALLRGAPPDAPAATGTLVVLNKAAASASLIDLSLGREVARVATGVGPHEVIVSPDGRTAVVCDYGEQQPGSTLTLFDVASAKQLKTIDLAPHRRPHGIMWLGEEARVAVTSETSKALLIVDLESGKVSATIATGQEATHMVALAPACDRAYTANISSGTLTALDLVAETSLGNVKTGAGCEGIDVTPDGAFVWTANRAADTVSVVDTASLQVVATLPCASFPIRCKATPDGRHVLVSCAKSGDVALFDAVEKKLVARIATALAAPAAPADQSTLGNEFAGSSVPIGILVHPDGKFAYVAHGNADLVSILDLATRTQVGTLATGKAPDGLGWSPLAVDAAARTAKGN
ncbi:MAG: YncE family protein [Planctomycetes bacterium]|nr:YncE family protein [Planctomycetota bacterium]